jgi:CheY-like chemotaxis protein
VKDIPAMVPHPDPDVMQQPLSLRQRPLSREKAWHFERRLGEVKEEGMQDLSETEAARPMSSAKLERGLSSDAKFPRIPTPNLNGSKPRLGYGMPKQVDPPSAKPQAEEGAEAEAPISLLLVDDNPINLQLLVTYATKFGHHKTVATDGLQAVEAYRTLALERNPSRSNSTSSQKLSSSPPQSSSSDQTSPPPPPTGPIIILMDINMPILNGFEASRQIRGFEQQRGIPPATIIALTGLGSADAQKEAFSSGVDLFLTKPVRLKELTKILEGVRKG